MPSAPQVSTLIVRVSDAGLLAITPSMQTIIMFRFRDEREGVVIIVHVNVPILFTTT